MLTANLKTAIALVLVASVVAIGASGPVVPCNNDNDDKSPPPMVRSDGTNNEAGRSTDSDRDGDGLSDFQEVHKYFTDPDNRDSDGDDKPDGDLHERREYTYTIRTVIRVLLPIHEAEIANDDYQDARVIARTDRYAELEVIHYPLNTVASGIVANPDWRADASPMGEYLKPGLTTNWDAAMRERLLKDLAADDIHIEKLTDRQVVQRVSAWLLKRVKSGSYFNIFHVHFVDGKPEPFPGQENSVGDRGDPKWTLEEQWEHELFGRQMYQHRSCGTCTSTAILLTTVMKAVGIPTRMILCTPLVDASGGDNVELVRKGLTHHAMSESILSALKPLKNANASHTFCEVFVGKRWRRLNFSVLGQNTLDRNLFGLLTHVNTFNDFADARLAATWGGASPMRFSVTPMHIRPWKCLICSAPIAGSKTRRSAPPSRSPTWSSARCIGSNRRTSPTASIGRNSNKTVQAICFCMPRSRPSATRRNTINRFTAM